MVESEAQVDVLGGLQTAIEAFERGLDEYQTQFHAWSQDHRKQVGREMAMAEEYTAATARELEEHAQQLARDQEALAQDKAGLERFRAELDALAAECDRRERASREREDSLGQKYSSHEETSASLQEREKQLDQRQCELQGRFEKSQQEFEDRKGVLASAEKVVSEQRKRFDRDHQEMARFRDELAQRERELALQSAANDDARQKLAQLSDELDARQRNLEGEDDGLSTRRSQIDCRAAELASLESQLQTRLAEIDARARALDDDAGRLKKKADDLAERERELERTAARLAKETAEHLTTSREEKRRERELADATRELSSRAEGLEKGRREIEAQQHAIQAATQEHQQHEQELAERQRISAKRQTALEEADGRLRASHQALQAERDELGTIRKSVEAELAARRKESARKEAETLVRRDQVERDQKSVEQRAQSLDRQCEEFERRSKSLAEREGELNGQQAKLEAAMQSLRNDQTAVEKARSVVTEVDESRWRELNEVKAEFNAMQREIELARARESELEGALGKVQAANAREVHAGENARETARRLTEELENEKRAAAEQRAAIFAQCLIAAGLKGPSADAEHEVFALLEGVKTQSVGSNALVVSSPNDSRVVGLPPDSATLLVQQQKSHTAVATFWADFKPAPSPVGPLAVAPTPTKTGVPDTTAEASLTAIPQDVEAQEQPSEEAVDSQASAMRTALAAVRAEAEAAKHKEPTAARSGPNAKVPSTGRKCKAGNSPIQFTREMAQNPAPALVAKEPAAVLASIDLDPETANRLRMMRRLNPTMSDQELLAKISAEGNSPGRAKRRKGWFALK